MTLAERWRLMPRRHKILLAICLAVPAALSYFQATDPPSTPTKAPAQEATTPKPEGQPVDPKLALAAARMIRAWGYDCRTVDAVTVNAWTTAFSHESWSVYCNHFRYGFTLENHGGKWLVTAD
jgi:hypothetical protein